MTKPKPKILSPEERLIGATETITPEIREKLKSHVLSYLHTDLLCYREPTDRQLAERQTEQWDPVLKFIEARFGVAIVIVHGVRPVRQDDKLEPKVAGYLDALADSRLVALQALVGVLGSWMLAVALVEGEITAQQAIAAAFLDEHYQQLRWGADEEMAERQGEIAHEVEAISQFLLLAKR